MTWFFSILFRPSVATASSIHSGWYQSAWGIRPNLTSASVSSVTRLWFYEHVIWNKRQGYTLFELLCKRLFVQEDVGISEFLVESVLHLLHAGYNALQITVSSQHDDGGIRFAAHMWRRGYVPVWPIIVLGDWSLIRRQVGRAHNLLLDFRDWRRLAVCFVRETQNVMQTDLWETSSARRAQILRDQRTIMPSTRKM